MANDYELYFTIAEEVPVVEYVAKAVKVVQLMYEFGKESAEDRAIRLLNEQVAVMRADIDHINERLDVLTARVAQAENRARLRQLVEHHIDVQALAARLERVPDQDELADIATNSALRIGAMLDDADLWLWSDIGRRRAPNGDEVLELADPEFKVLPLPVLAAAVVVFTLAASQHIAGDAAARQRYAADLARFRAAVMMRTNWVDLEARRLHPEDVTQPVTLPEQIRSRITVTPHPVTRYVTNDQCSYGLVSVNRIERTTTVLRDVSMHAPAGATSSTLCTAPANLGLSDEASLEDEYGPIVLLRTLAEMLDRVATRGTLHDDFVGQFPDVTLHALFLYAIEPDGRLVRFECRTDTRLTGSVRWTSSGSPIGNGWQSFDAVVAGDWNVLYAVQPDRSVLWYRHDGAPTNANAWSGPTTVALARSGLGISHEECIAGSNGVLYRAVRSRLPAGGSGPLGQLRLRTELTADRHPGVATGTPSFTGQVTLHANWPQYVTAFGDSEGVIYGIDPEGRLFWHKHVDAASGGRTLLGPLKIGTGWNSFVRVFCAGWGFLFGVYANGTMVAYHLDNWRTGPTPGDPPRWHGPVAVAGSEWNGFLRLVPMLQAEPPLVR